MIRVDYVKAGCLVQLITQIDNRKGQRVSGGLGRCKDRHYKQNAVSGEEVHGCWELCFRAAGCNNNI